MYPFLAGEVNVADDRVPLTFDPQRRQLHFGDETVELRPKEANLLQYLIERTGDVVSAIELQKAVWPGVKVGADALKTVMYALRKRLGDSSQQPRYIENVPRRGYRFIGPLHHFPSLSASSSSETAPVDPPQHPTSSIAGREVELAMLSNLFIKASTGQRQIVFLTGELGIGKTTLVETFLQHLPSTPATLVARSQSIEQYGKREEYRPLLEAIGWLYQQYGDKDQLMLLHNHAPMVLAELPAVLSSAERKQLQQEILGASQGRMLREFVAVLEALSHNQRLVFVVEDLHWSDPSTIDVLLALAQRSDPAQLLVIGTYRPMDALRDAHPVHAVVQTLLERGGCQELQVPPFSEGDVTSYLATRVADSGMIPEALCSLLHQRTAGNPRFLLDLVDALGSHGVAFQTATPAELAQTFAQLKVPPTTTHLIERQLRRLTPAEQEVLLAASVIGNEFSAEAVAEGLKQDVVQVETICEALATRQQFVQRQGARRIPERRRSTRYVFRHALYSEVFALSIPAARYHQLHQWIEQWRDKTR